MIKKTLEMNETQFMKDERFINIPIFEIIIIYYYYY